MKINANLRRIFYKIYFYLLSSIEIQLIITLVSLPILTSWGLPISKMTLIGNLVFLPFLTIFLGLSSIIFFTELLYIPNNIIIYLLEKTTNFWQAIMLIGNKNWLIPFGKTNIFILLTIPIFTFLIIKKRTITKNKRILLLILLLFSYGFLLKIKTNLLAPNQITIEDKLVIKKDKKNKLKIKDLGLFARKESIEKFVEYNLRQEIIKNYGTLNIKRLSVKGAGIRTFKAIISMSKFFNLEEVRLPYFNKKLTKYGWKLFFDMKRTLEKNNIKLIRK